MSKSKTEYLKCGFNGEEEGREEVTMGCEVIPRAEKFRYSGSIIEEGEIFFDKTEKGDINDDINQRIRLGWKKRKIHLEYCAIRKFM